MARWYGSGRGLDGLHVPPAPTAVEAHRCAAAVGGAQDEGDTRPALGRIENYQGVTGTMRFQPGSGDPIKSAVILQIRDGKFAWVANAEP